MLLQRVYVDNAMKLEVDTFSMANIAPSYTQGIGVQVHSKNGYNLPLVIAAGIHGNDKRCPGKIHGRQYGHRNANCICLDR